MLRLAYDATRFQPPKEIAEAMTRRSSAQRPGWSAAARAAARRQALAADMAAAGGGQRRWWRQRPRRPGRPRRPAARCPSEMLKTAGVDQARVDQDHGRDAIRNAEDDGLHAPPPGAAGGWRRRHHWRPGLWAPRKPDPATTGHAGTLAPRCSRRRKAIFRRNLNEQEYAAVSKATHGDAVPEARHRLQGQRKRRT